MLCEGKTTDREGWLTLEGAAGGWPSAHVVYYERKEARMKTKELIQAEIDSVSEEHLDELYRLIKQFAQSKQHAQKPSFMARLKNIKIDAPEDFATNLDI
jgi:acyl-CoA-binding protein